MTFVASSPAPLTWGFDDPMPARSPGGFIQTIESLASPKMAFANLGAMGFDAVRIGGSNAISRASGAAQNLHSAAFGARIAAVGSRQGPVASC